MAPMVVRRATLLLLSALCLALLVVVASAEHAQAHAVLVDAEPADGSTLDHAPEQVRLTFNETVSVVPGGIRLFSGSHAPQEVAARSQGSAVVVELPTELSHGSYGVAWRVISADSHPVSGVLTFNVGAATHPLDVAQPSDAALGIQRFLKATHYGGLLLLVGVTIFVAFIAEPGQLRRRPTQTLLRGAAGVVVGSAVLLIPVTAMAILGRPPRSIVAPAEWSRAVSGGSVVAALLTVLGVVGLRLAWPMRRHPASPALPTPPRIAVLPLAVLAVSPVFTGHSMSVAPRALTVAADLVHIGTAAVWLGGVVGLVVLLTPRAGDVGSAGRAVQRFATVAAAAVVTLGASGVVLAVLILPGWQALVGSNYGRGLLTKLGLVAIALGLAWWNRTRLLPAIERPATMAAAWARLRRVVAYEAAIIVIAVAVTATVVTLDPRQRGHDPDAGTPGVEVTAGGEWETTVGELRVTGRLEDTTLDLRVTTPEGIAVDLYAAPVIQARLPVAELGPIAIDTQHEGAGTYRAHLTVPAAGRWEFLVPVRPAKYEEHLMTLHAEITDPTARATPARPTLAPNRRHR